MTAESGGGDDGGVDSGDNDSGGVGGKWEGEGDEWEEREGGTLSS